MRIPPPGSDPSEIASFCDTIVQELAKDDRRLAWEIEAERGLNLYLGNHFTTGRDVSGNTEGAEFPSHNYGQAANGMIRLVLNRIQNCIISLMAIQGGDPPKVTFTPRESGEPPIYYLNTNIPEGQSIGTQTTQQAAMVGVVWGPTQPLPDAEVANLQQLIAMGEQAKAQAGAAGLPPPAGIIPAEVLVEVSDRTCSEILQVIYDAMWEACDGQYTFVENILNKNIVGWQPTLYEFDDEAKQHILTNIHPLQVFFDGTRSDLRRIQVAIYDEPVSADEAKAMYPDLAAEIDEWASAGPLRFPGSRMYTPAFRYTQNFYREMLVIRHCWFRNQPYPMTPKDAVKSGKLQQGTVPTGNMIPNPDPTAADPATGAPGAMPETRPAIVHPQTGEEVTPQIPGVLGQPQANPKWPCCYGIRQIRIVANQAVQDKQCEHDDIPLPTNINIPVPYSPYAQGEPLRLEGIQMALNYVLSAIVTHQRYNAFPPEIVAESVVAMMDKALQECRAKPGQRIVVPDSILSTIKTAKDVIATLDVAALPADFWKLLQFLVEMIDKEGNQSDVMSGNASASWSGDAIASLQNAASQVIRAKSMMTEFYVRRLARLQVGSIINRMEPEDWKKYCTKYPWQALQAMHTHAKDLDINISVQITSGSGASKQSETNNLVAARKNGVPVSDPTLMERMNLDPDVELTQQADFNRKRAASMPQQPQMPAGKASLGKASPPQPTP